MTNTSKTLIDTTINLNSASESIQQVLDAMPDDSDWPVMESNARVILFNVADMLDDVNKSLRSESIDTITDCDELETQLYELRGISFLIRAVGTEIEQTGTPETKDYSAFLLLSQSMNRRLDAIEKAVGLN